MKLQNILFFYVIIIFITIPIFGMNGCELTNITFPDSSSTPSSFVHNGQAILEEYKKIVEPLNSEHLEQQNVDKIYTALVNFFNKDKMNETNCLTKEHILDSPLHDGKRLIHYIVKLSSTKTLILNQFWNLLFDNNIKINIEDNDGNTPLLDSCIGKTIQNYETVQLLLYYHANPTIENKGKISPIIIINDHHDQTVNSLLNNKGDYLSSMYASILQNACNRYTNTFNKL